jgi:hypothetical protein
MDKKYIAKTISLTGAQAEALTACKAVMEEQLGVTLSYSQVVAILARKYQQERA